MPCCVSVNEFDNILVGTPEKVILIPDALVSAVSLILDTPIIFDEPTY